MKIPIVDLKNIGLNNSLENLKSQDYKKVGEELGKAFESIGFVYIVNHGLSQDKIDELFALTKDFFHQPKNVKTSIARDPKTNQGYVAPSQEIFPSLSENDGNKSVKELRESFDIMDVRPESIYPDKHVPKLRLAMTEFAKTTAQLLDRILKSLAYTLNMPEDYFIQNHGGYVHGVNSKPGGSKIRSIYYPPINEEIIKNKKEDEVIVRCGAHSDYGTITLLFQDMIGGLEVWDIANKSWVPATPIKGGIVVNIGDLLEIWSDGRFPSTLHRVRVPDEEIKLQTLRQSMAFFVHPLAHVMIEPLNGNKKSKYKPVNSLQHLLNRLNESYQY